MIGAKTLDDSMAVRTQMQPAEMEAAAKEGFRSVINNRPDGEEPGQPTSAEIEAAARAAGLEYRHIPMTPGQLTQETMARFADALDTLPQPVLAFCRTGTRSSALWACARAKPMGADAVLEATAHAGYDFGQMRPLFEKIAG